jgi:signal transduction histidine kinase
MKLRALYRHAAVRWFAARFTIALSVAIALFTVVVVAAHLANHRQNDIDAARDSIAEQIYLISHAVYIARRQLETQDTDFGAPDSLSALQHAQGALTESYRCSAAEAGETPPEVAAIFSDGGRYGICARFENFLGALGAFIDGTDDRERLLGRMRLVAELIREKLIEADAVYKVMEADIKATHERLHLVYQIVLTGLIAAIAAGFALTSLPAMDRAFDDLEAANAALRREADAARRAGDAAREARDEAQRADRVKTEFLARLNHEVRTPLNAVIGLSDLIASSGDRAADRERLTVIRHNGETLGRLLDDMIDVSRIASGDFALENAPCDVAAVVAAVGAVRRPAAEAKGLALEIDIGEPARGLWLGDARRIRRVVCALTENAIRFTPEGRVLVRLDRAPRVGLRLTVEDSGPGVPPRMRESIFEAFAQADGSATRAFGGLGQGLAIVRGVARAMGGDVSVRASELGGARFDVTLPLLSLSASARRHAPVTQA